MDGEQGEDGDEWTIRKDQLSKQKLQLQKQSTEEKEQVNDQMRG